MPPKRKRESLPDQILAHRIGGEEFWEAGPNVRVFAVAISELASEVGTGLSEIAQAIDQQKPDNSVEGQQIADAISDGLDKIARSISERE